MIHGVLNVYKEKGYTSHDVVGIFVLLHILTMENLHWRTVLSNRQVF